MDNDLMTQAEQDALAVLAENHRLLIILVPEGAPDDFVARLTAWSNFILDTRLLLPMPLPTARKGDGLVCPYCDQPATSNPRLHAAGCDWREAMLRWGAAQLQIEQDFGGKA